MNHHQISSASPPGARGSMLPGRNERAILGSRMGVYLREGLVMNISGHPR